MSLEGGNYYITSVDGGFPIGRKTAEDRSLRPKGIYKLPQGTESMWTVERLDNGNYKLQNRGAIVGGALGHLFAFLIPEEAAAATTEWTFKRDELNKDPNAFIILEANGHDGWVAPDSNFDFAPHILLRPLIAGLSEPPTYPPNQVFIFKKVDA
ncbi:hypothetical protein V8D89_004208 [Ganoderma adspersum]